MGGRPLGRRMLRPAGFFTPKASYPRYDRNGMGCAKRFDEERGSLVGGHDETLRPR
jgi:hypothetical protein